jgi:hypothetical protein
LGEEPALKKRVCENCRFFQEAGFAKNGWCNNPQRKETSDVKLVVRRNELACRNGWAQDLWVLRTDDDEAADVVLNDTIVVRPVPPASVEEMSFLVNSHRDKQPTSDPPPVIPPVDVVVGESPSTKPVAAERQSLLAHDPRAAILKARERYRARMIAESRHGDVAKMLDDRVFRQSDVVEPQTPVSPIRRDLFPPTAAVPRPSRANEVPPVQISEVPRTFPTMTSFPEDEVRFSSVPEPVEGIALPRPDPKRRDNIVAPSDAAAKEAPAAVESAELPATTITVSLADEPIERHEVRSRGGRRPGPQADLSVDQPLPVEEVERDEPMLVEAAANGDRIDRRRFEFGGRRRVERVAAVVEAPIEVESEPQFDDVVAPPAFEEIVADVNPMIEIAPHVPRMCRTCRDFRPADAGGRGWCTNKWAFSHRRMVDADELPCETSVGCWWLPHDDVWMATADVSAHGQPTPLVDHWLTHKVGSATDAAEPRRRQRS